jgi:hypothetical protein
VGVRTCHGKDCRVLLDGAGGGPFDDVGEATFGAHFIGKYTISVANRTSKVLCSMRRRRTRELLIRSGADSDIAVIETQVRHPVSIKVKQFTSREHRE